MMIESEGVTTEVSREYEPELHTVRTASDAVAVHLETPALDAVTQAVASAAAIAHRPAYFKES